MAWHGLARPGLTWHGLGWFLCSLAENPPALLASLRSVAHAICTRRALGSADWSPPATLENRNIISTFSRKSSSTFSHHRCHHHRHLLRSAPPILPTAFSAGVHCIQSGGEHSSWSPLPPSSTARTNEKNQLRHLFVTTFHHFSPPRTTTHHRPPPETTRDHSRPLPGSTWRPPSADSAQPSHRFLPFYFFIFSSFLFFLLF